MMVRLHSGLRYFKRKAQQSFRFRPKTTVAFFCTLAITGFFLANWLYQVIRKPGELFAPISASMAKSPDSTWQTYGALFEKYSTNVISPEFVAALAQVESDGNPVALTYWRWRWSWNPFDIYRPASSALGMFQMTDGTFAQARKYCIRDHKVVSDGPWYDLSSCWFNGFYTRTLPSHAVELTAAYLHRSVGDTLARGRAKKASPAQKQQLAAVIHLCGPKRGEIFTARGFRLTPGETCGTHDLRRYLTKVDMMQKRFTRLTKIR